MVLGGVGVGRGANRGGVLVLYRAVCYRGGGLRVAEGRRKSMAGVGGVCVWAVVGF